MEVGHFVNNTWEIKKRIGKGGFCNVFVGKSRTSDTMVAIKVAKDQADGTVKWEAEVLRMVGDSPCIPQFIYSSTEHRLDYIVMEYLDGEDLGKIRDAIRNSSQSNLIPLPVAVYLGRQMLGCIRVLHERGFIHRDIKPANFIRKSKESTQFCIVDFGIAKMISHPPVKKDHQEFRGTTYYASPFMHDGEPNTPRDDLFSWVYSFLDFLCGRLPWTDASKSRDKQSVALMKKECFQQPNNLIEWMKATISTIEAQYEPLLHQCEPNFPDIAQQKILELLCYMQSLGLEDEIDYDRMDNLLGQCISQPDKHPVHSLTYVHPSFSWEMLNHSFGNHSGNGCLTSSYHSTMNQFTVDLLNSLYPQLFHHHVLPTWDRLASFAECHSSSSSSLSSSLSPSSPYSPLSPSIPSASPILSSTSMNHHAWQASTPTENPWQQARIWIWKQTMTKMKALGKHLIQQESNYQREKGLGVEGMLQSIDIFSKNSKVITTTTTTTTTITMPMSTSNNPSQTTALESKKEEDSSSKSLDTLPENETNHHDHDHHHQDMKVEEEINDTGNSRNCDQSGMEIDHQHHHHHQQQQQEQEDECQDMEQAEGNDSMVKEGEGKGMCENNEENPSEFSSTIDPSGQECLGNAVSCCAKQDLDQLNSNPPKNCMIEENQNQQIRLNSLDTTNHDDGRILIEGNDEPKTDSEQDPSVVLSATIPTMTSVEDSNFKQHAFQTPVNTFSHENCSVATPWITLSIALDWSTSFLDLLFYFNDNNFPRDLLLGLYACLLEARYFVGISDLEDFSDRSRLSQEIQQWTIIDTSLDWEHQIQQLREIRWQQYSEIQRCVYDFLQLRQRILEKSRANAIEMTKSRHGKASDLGSSHSGSSNSSSQKKRKLLFG